MEYKNQINRSQNALRGFIKDLDYTLEDLDKQAESDVKRYLINDLAKLKERITSFMNETDTW